MPNEQKPRLKLYHASPSRSSITLWMLEELGEPYAIELIDLKKGEQLEPAYLAINPMGKVPALDDDGIIVTEGAAICCYLADAFPKAGLAADVVIGSGLRWGMLFKLLPEWPEFVAYTRRLAQRPALQQQIARDEAFARQGAG